jgi:hypothetical protein
MKIEQIILCLLLSGCNILFAPTISEKMEFIGALTVATGPSVTKHNLLNSSLGTNLFYAMYKVLPDKVLEWLEVIWRKNIAPLRSQEEIDMIMCAKKMQSVEDQWDGLSSAQRTMFFIMMADKMVELINKPNNTPAARDRMCQFFLLKKIAMASDEAPSTPRDQTGGSRSAPTTPQTAPAAAPQSRVQSVGSAPVAAPASSAPTGAAADAAVGEK